MNRPQLPHFTDFVDGKSTAAARTGGELDLIAPQVKFTGIFV
jgi:hypothetical protein